MKIIQLTIWITILVFFGCNENNKKTWSKNCLTRELDIECYSFLDSILHKIVSIENAQAIRTTKKVNLYADGSVKDSVEIYEKPNGQLFAIKKHRGINYTLQSQFFKIDDNHFAVIIPKLDGPKHIDSIKTSMKIILFRDSSIILFRNIVNRLVDTNYPGFNRYEEYYWKEINKTFAIKS